MGPIFRISLPFADSFHYHIIQSYIAIIVLYVTIFSTLLRLRTTIRGTCCRSWESGCFHSIVVNENLFSAETHVPYGVSSHEIKTNLCQYKLDNAAWAVEESGLKRKAQQLALGHILAYLMGDLVQTAYLRVCSVGEDLVSVGLCYVT